jgi:hypothetical protein
MGFKIDDEEVRIRYTFFISLPHDGFVGDLLHVPTA